MRSFDRKFGVDFLAGVPSSPGVYRLYAADGALLYVGKARDLRRRLAQYRTTRRTKSDRKRRALVKAAGRISWDVCESEREALLTEIKLIQGLRPRANVAGATPFLYPFVGIRVGSGETDFCLTTSPEAFPSFELYGAFRSRDVTGEAFFALGRLLRLVGHPTPRTRRQRRETARYSHVLGFRRLPVDWPGMWRGLLRGTSREALEHLCLRLVDHPGARARRALVQEDLRAIVRFFNSEASRLAAAIEATGYTGYPVAQRDRDPLFLEYRERAGARPVEVSRPRSGG